MKRLLFAAALAVLFGTAGTASAQYLPAESQVGSPIHTGDIHAGPVVNSYSPDLGCAGGDCGGGAAWGGPASPYGWNPIWRNWKLRKHGCNGFGGGPGFGGHGQGGYGYAPQVQGTLVFPQHQFARSPRDFFMVNH